VQGSPVLLHVAGGAVGGAARCVRKVFTARSAELAEPWARRTNRSRDVVRLIWSRDGRAPGGERLMSRLAMAVSDDTILRAVKPLNLVRRSVVGRGV
jgi:hypothetical protein